MKNLILWMFFVPLFGYSQPSKIPSINWVADLSWDQLLSKASNENKYIFIDCFATWCKPCRLMDINVFSNDTVAQTINKYFLPLRIQMDKTKKDNEFVTMYYPVARKIEEEFNITSYPSYIFLSPNGNIVHKVVGYQDINKFIASVEDALNPSNQLWTLIEKWKHNEIAYKNLPSLIEKVFKSGEVDISKQIFQDYVKNYLNELPSKKFFTIEHLKFFDAYRDWVTTKDRIFDYYYKKSESVDTKIGKVGYSRIACKEIIESEYVHPLLKVFQRNKQAPDWEQIESDLNKKYKKEIVEGIVLSAKVNWYQNAGNWNEWIKYIKAYVDWMGIPNLHFNFLNFSAWYVFETSNDENLLTTALKWADASMSMGNDQPWAVMDTKAWLLYKLGRFEEAISLEKKIIELYPAVKNQFLPNIEKMKNKQ